LCVVVGTLNEQHDSQSREQANNKIKKAQAAAERDVRVKQQL